MFVKREGEKKEGKKKKKKKKKKKLLKFMHAHQADMTTVFVV